MADNGRRRQPAPGDRCGSDPRGPSGRGRSGSGERGWREDTGPLPVEPTAEQGPPQPTGLGRRSWWMVLRRTVKELQADNLTDWAAALTYYAMMSLFPGLLVLISALRLFGANTTRKVIDTITAMAPGTVRDVLRAAAGNLQHSRQTTAGAFAVVGLAAALWSASAYIAAFMRASNAIYDVPEGRPVWKTLPIRIGVTVLTGVLLAITALAVVFTGGLAQQLGNLVHLGSEVVKVWDVVKWPVLAVLVSLLLAVLYWAAPNARPGGFRWVSPGGLLAVLVWLAASAGFAFYIANFGNYNKTYGSLAAVIIFLIWLWISNIAFLLGAEFDAELQRERAAKAGHPSHEEPYLELRDTRKLRDDRRGDLQ